MSSLLWKDCVPRWILRLDDTIRAFTVAFFCHTFELWYRKVNLCFAIDTEKCVVWVLFVSCDNAAHLQSLE